MKRPNKNIWPGMRPDTLRAIHGELTRARKKYPARGLHLDLLRSYTEELVCTMIEYNHDHSSATQIYAVAATIAAMAVRIMEEGSLNFRYAGNTRAPDFKLTE